LHQCQLASSHDSEPSKGVDKTPDDDLDHSM